MTVGNRWRLRLALDVGSGCRSRRTQADALDGSFRAVEFCPRPPAPGFSQSRLKGVVHRHRDPRKQGQRCENCEREPALHLESASRRFARLFVAEWIN